MDDQEEYPRLGSREWFQSLWTRAFCAGDRAGWNFRQALALTQGQHLCVFPSNLRGMPRFERDWWLRISDVPDDRLIGYEKPTPEPLTECGWCG